MVQRPGYSRSQTLQLTPTSLPERAFQSQGVSLSLDLVGIRGCPSRPPGAPGQAVKNPTVGTLFGSGIRKGLYKVS